MSNLCIRWERIANEILMFFRSQRKLAGDVSLSDCIETGKDGTMLSLMDVVCDEEDLFDRVSTREMTGKLLAAMERTLTDRERKVLTLRYGLFGCQALPQHQQVLCVPDREKGHGEAAAGSGAGDGDIEPGPEGAPARRFSVARQGKTV